MNGENDLILRLRLAGLKNNLEQVRDIKTSVARRRDEIQDLLEVFDVQEGIQQTASMLADTIKTCVQYAEALSRAERVPARMVERLSKQLAEAQTDAEQINKQAERTADTIDAMGRRWLALPADPFDRHMDQIFKSKAEILLDKLGQLENEPVSEAWTQYLDIFRVGGEELFAEYVEFLGGLAMRNTGFENVQFDPDVCHMADDLIKQIYYIGGTELWHSMAIPARRDATARTMARMIRLGFPEWTVWAAPLAAYEFGRVVLSVNDVLGNYVAAEGGADPLHLKACLADAFATWAMGPAYANASVLLRFEPVAPRGQRPADPADGGGAGPHSPDQERAHVVFTMLDLMDGDAEIFAGVRQGLHKLWSAALEQVGVEPQLHGATADRLAGWTRHMWEFLSDKARPVVYESDRWERVTTWENLGELAGANEDELFRLKPGEEDVRDILNAAWYQRMQSPSAEHELAEAALNM
jgi:hypothetical protein